VITTIGLIATAGFAASEMIELARAWIRLRDDAKKATTLGDIERAAPRFGMSRGGAELRILVALTTALIGKVLPASVAAPRAGPPALAVSTGGGTVAVAQGGITLKLVKDGIAIVNAPLAMSKPHGGGGGARIGSGASGGGKAPASSSSGKAPASGNKAARGSAAAAKAGPGKWKRVNETMSERAARYQRQITGRPVDEAYVVDGVRFDGYRNGKLVDMPEALLEAKGPGYKTFVAEKDFVRWFRSS